MKNIKHKSFCCLLSPVVHRLESVLLIKTLFPRVAQGKTEPVVKIKVCSLRQRTAGKQRKAEKMTEAWQSAAATHYFLLQLFRPLVTPALRLTVCNTHPSASRNTTHTNMQTFISKWLFFSCAFEPVFTYMHRSVHTLL